MKRLIVLPLVPFTLIAGAQTRLKQQWITDSVLRVPESVLYHNGENVLYVSQIGGNPNANKEGKGSIARLTPDGKIIDSAWATGLNSPKGMARYGNLLYVADATEVAVIDMQKATVAYRLPVDSAVFLNDVTIDNLGNVYVSDSRRNKVHIIRRKQVSLYLDNVNNANGLLAANGVLYVLSAGRLLEVNEEKKITVLATGLEKSTDGLVQIAENEFIVTSWAGIIYSVKKDGTVRQLEDFRSSKTNTADIGYNPKTGMLYVPTFWANRVIAYHVE
jgi:hypothetical protein